MQPKAMHQAIHHKGRPGHVPRILQDSQGNIKEHHHGHKDQNPANTGEDTIHQQTFKPGPG